MKNTERKKIGTGHWHARKQHYNTETVISRGKDEIHFYVAALVIYIMTKRLKTQTARASFIIGTTIHTAHCQT